MVNDNQSQLVVVNFRVNGIDRQVSVEPRYALADVLRDELLLTGLHLGRARCLRCLHGSDQRRAGGKLSDVGCGGGRVRYSDDRAPFGWHIHARETRTVLYQARCISMRVLHARFPRHGAPLAGQGASQGPGYGSGQTERQRVPVHWVRSDHRRHRRGGCGRRSQMTECSVTGSLPKNSLLRLIPTFATFPTTQNRRRHSPTTPMGPHW